MKQNRLKSFGQDMAQIADVVAKCPEVTRYDEGDDKEAWTLAHAFLDLRDSFETFLEDQLPKLLEGKLNEKEAHDLLLDIGEEFRHIIYHLKDPKFNRYLAPAWLNEDEESGREQRSRKT